MLSNLDSIEIVNCNQLILNLSTEPRFNYSRVISIQVHKAKELQMILDNEQTLFNSILLDQVEKVETLFQGDPKVTDSSGMTTEELYFYIIIGLAGLLLISWIALIAFVSIYCCGQKPKKSKKKVARAESWRYESNIYVNPNRGQGQNQQGRVMRATESALHELLPYQMVPSSPEQRPMLHYNPAIHQSGYNQAHTGSSASNKSGRNNVYTDSSLQYVDESSDNEDSHHTESISNANSASYGSRNKNPTLPIVK